MPGKDLLLQDNLVVGSCSYPAAAATATTSFIDLGSDAGYSESKDQFEAERVEFQLQIPVLTGTQMPNSTTMSYTIFTTDVNTTNAASNIPLYTVPTSYGYAANGSFGAPAINYTVRLPLSVGRYLYAAVTASASTVATSAVLTLVALF